jgi:hypothetical protein
MKTSRWFFVIVVFIILVVQPMHSVCGELIAVEAIRMDGGYFFDGNVLVGLMREYEAYIKGGECNVRAGEYMAYIMGVEDAYERVVPISPDDATGNQIVAIVSKYLKTHPEQWSESAASLVAKALKQAFPLRKSK